MYNNKIKRTIGKISGNTDFNVRRDILGSDLDMIIQKTEETKNSMEGHKELNLYDKKEIIRSMDQALNTLKYIRSYYNRINISF